MHEARGRKHECRSRDDRAGAEANERESARHEELALAAEELIQAAEHRVAAGDTEGARAALEVIDRQRTEATGRERRAHELEARVRARIARRQARDRQGLRRLRPGPPAQAAPAWMATSLGDDTADLDREIDAIAHALDEHGPTDRRELARLVGARYCGPGRYRVALREAVDEGRARRVSRQAYGPAEHDEPGGTS